VPDTDFGERTEQPTVRRRQQARERGQVARSNDLTAAIVLAGGLLVLNLLGGRLVERLAALMRGGLAQAHRVSMDLDGARSVLAEMLGGAAAALLPALAAVALIALSGALLQVGAVFSTHPLLPAFYKISPIQGFKRLFSARSVSLLILSLLKVAVIGVIGYVTIAGSIERLLALVGASAWDIGVAAVDLTFTLGLRVCLALLILGIADYGFQRWQHERGLRMTRHELREEFKEMEGDPYARARRRRIQRQLALQRMMHDVPKADVVITNPTELALALRYDAAAMKAPRVVAKGAGYLAQRIRQRALQEGIPIVERKPLAQALYRAVEVGDEIPPDLYKAVAEVLAYVYHLSHRRAALVPQPLAAAAG
jgi:flagellar biosynthetic protein FlhB